MTLLALPEELAITITNGQVWLSIGLAVVCGAACLVLGTWICRLVGLLGVNAPAGETLGVGLASGLMVVAAWWAAIWSGGRSSFTPVAIGFAIAVGLAVVARFRRPKPVAANPSTPTARTDRRRSLGLTLLGAAVFIVAIALLYGATMAPSPRDGVQPVEFMDEAFYAVLGRDLATTGLETNLLASGFDQLPGLPPQSWYHWGELWLTAAVLTSFDVDPLAARNFVVLPLLILAAGALVGTLVRRITRTRSRKAYVFGFVVCLFLAPVPLPGPFFSSWATGMIFGITLYGLGAVSVLLAMYGVVALGERRPSWALAMFAGTGAALILPAHIILALLAVLGFGSIWTFRIIQAAVTRRRPHVSPIWFYTVPVAALVLVATGVWGSISGHAIGGSAVSETIPRFHRSWVQVVLTVYLGAGVFLAIPLAWALTRRTSRHLADIFLGTVVILVVGAFAWGARLSDFNMFHVFFAGLGVIAVPVAAAAVALVWSHLKLAGRRRLALALAVACTLQLEYGVLLGVFRLQQFGPHEEYPVPLTVLAAIRELPPDAKLAYACVPIDEVAFTVPRLVGIDAHTGRRVVPMCYQADFFSTLIGGEKYPKAPSPSFLLAPQRTLYPDAAARPSREVVVTFLKEHGINYIFEDKRHPNTLVPDAVPLVADGDHALLRVP